MTDYFSGRCPICSGRLAMGPEISKCENDDFICDTRKYLERWEEYENSMTVLTEVLLNDLRGLNTLGTLKSI